MRSLIGIIKPYSESALNNLYAFFLNPKEEHGLNHLFLESLLDLIYDVYDCDIVSFPYEVLREYRTDKGNYIDILVHYIDPNQRSKNSAIIIENKIYHDLINDLKDYWSDIDYVNNKNKILLIISCQKQNITRVDIENIKQISHFELKEAFLQRYANSVLELSDKTKFIIEDYFAYIDELYLKSVSHRALLEQFWNNAPLDINNFTNVFIQHFIDIRNSKKYGNYVRGRHFEGIRYYIDIDIINKSVFVDIEFNTSKINDNTFQISAGEINNVYQTNISLKPSQFNLVNRITRNLTPNHSITDELENIFLSLDEKEDKILGLYLKKQRNYFLIELKKAIKDYIDDNYEIFLGISHFEVQKDQANEFNDDFVVFRSLVSKCCFSLYLKRDYSLIASFWTDSKRKFRTTNSNFMIHQKEDIISLKESGDTYYYKRRASKIYHIQDLTTITQQISNILKEFTYFFKKYRKKLN